MGFQFAGFFAQGERALLDAALARWPVVMGASSLSHSMVLVSLCLLARLQTEIRTRRRSKPAN